MFDLKNFTVQGDVALGAGGVAGIGRAIALTLAAAGAAIMVSGQILTGSGGGVQELG